VRRRQLANNTLVFVGCGLALFAAAILHFFPPEAHGFYPRCTLYAWTGLHCPGCGSLRALSALTHGDLRDALHSNLLLILAIPTAAVLLGLRRWRHGDWAVMSWVPPWGWWFFLVVILGFGFIRNLPGVPFDALHP
jgi:hypothetical protein